MQALKDDKDAFGELRVEANAVVAHREDPFVPCPLCPNVDTRRLGTVELDGIAQQVLEYHDQLSVVSF